MKRFTVILVTFLLVISANAKPAKTKAKKAKLGVSIELAQAEEYVLASEFEKAMNIYNRVIGKNPKNIAALSGRAELYILLDMYNNAIRDYNSVIAIDSSSAYSWYRLAYAKHQSDSISYAYFDYIHSLELDSSNVEVWRNLGLLCYSYDNIPTAVRAFNKVIEFEPNNPEPHKYLGIMKYRTEEHEEAIKQYELYLSKGRPDAYVYFNRGNSNFKLGNTDAAIADYSRAIELDSTFEDAYSNRIFIYSQLGKQEEIAKDMAILERIKKEKISRYDDGIDISKGKIFRDPGNKLSIYMPDQFHFAYFADTAVVSMSIAREEIKNIDEGFIVGVIAERILNPQKIIGMSEPTELLSYLRAYAHNTAENAINNYVSTEKQKPLTQYGPGAFYDMMRMETTFSVNSDPIVQYFVGFFRKNDIVIYRFIFPEALESKYQQVVQQAIDSFQFTD